MSDFGEREPLFIQPEYFECNKSQVVIPNFDEIVAYSQRGNTELYCDTDIGHYIESLDVQSEVFGVDTLPPHGIFALKSYFQLNSSAQFTYEELKQRFRDVLIFYSRDDDDRRRGEQYRASIAPFIVRSDTFDNAFIINSLTLDVSYMLWIDGQRRGINLSNYELITGIEDRNKKLSVIPPARAASVDDLKNFMKATIYVADLINGLGRPAVHGQPGLSSKPLQRKYLLEVSKIDKVFNDEPAQAIGRTALFIDWNDLRSEKKEVPPTIQNEIHMAEDLEAKKLADVVKKTDNEDLPSLAEIGGMERTKKEIMQIAAWFKHPEIMKKWGAERPGGIIFYGPAGVGKTMLAGALGKEIQADFLSIKSSGLYDMWLGNSAKNIQRLFDYLRQCTEKTVVFFDEIDAIIGISNRSADGATLERNQVSGIFKQELNTLSTDNPNIILVAATNDIERIDPALIRSGRFDVRIYVPLPDMETRKDIFVIEIANKIIAFEKHEQQVFGDLDPDELSKKSEGFSGADIKEVFRRLYIGKAYTEATTGAVSPISQQEIIDEINKFRTGS